MHQDSLRKILRKAVRETVAEVLQMGMELDREAYLRQQEGGNMDTASGGWNFFRLGNVEDPPQGSSGKVLTRLSLALLPAVIERGRGDHFSLRRRSEPAQSS